MMIYEFRCTKKGSYNGGTWGWEPVAGPSVGELYESSSRFEKVWDQMTASGSIQANDWQEGTRLLINLPRGGYSFRILGKLK